MEVGQVLVVSCISIAAASNLVHAHADRGRRNDSLSTANGIGDVSRVPRREKLPRCARDILPRMPKIAKAFEPSGRSEQELRTNDQKVVCSHQNFMASSFFLFLAFAVSSVRGLFWSPDSGFILMCICKFLYHIDYVSIRTAGPNDPLVEFEPIRRAGCASIPCQPK